MRKGYPHTHRVSILTLFVDRVRHQMEETMRKVLRVSILTLFVDRVRLDLCPMQCGGTRFQSSPYSSTGCDDDFALHAGLPPSFNPHPIRRQGATVQSEPSEHQTKRFNPHPIRRQGATSPTRAATSSSDCFNPHPIRRQGATSGSTVTGYIVYKFQSSPYSSTGCDMQDHVAQMQDMMFQSSPYSSTGCDRAGCVYHVQHVGFQSSPYSSTGCDVVEQLCPLAILKPVSILTLFVDRVRHAPSAAPAMLVTVSILTLFVDRVRPSIESTTEAGPNRFQSSPYSSTGCDFRMLAAMPGFVLVSILTLFVDRVRQRAPGALFRRGFRALSREPVQSRAANADQTILPPENLLFPCENHAARTPSLFDGTVKFAQFPTG